MEFHSAEIGPFDFIYVSGSFVEGTKAKVVAEKWPSEKERKQLKDFTTLLGRVEAQTGVLFDRNISLCDAPGTFQINGFHMITLDRNFLSDQSLVSRVELEDILTHEAGHSAAEDPKMIGKLLISAGALALSAPLSEFYHKEPDKFAHLIEKNFGGVQNFRLALESQAKAVEETVKSVEKLPQYAHPTDLGLLAELYDRDSLLSRNLADVPNHRVFEADGFLQTAGLISHSKEGIAAIRKQLTEKNIVPDDSQFASLFKPQHYDKINPAAKAELDKIDAEILIPAVERAKKYIAFVSAYSRAIEYRADDFTITHSSHPEQYPKALDKISIYLDQANAAMMPVSGQETHPSIANRIGRGEKLLKRIQTMKDAAGEVDIEKALLAVTREMIQQAKVSPKQGDVSKAFHRS